jgi:hypothetical protein
VIHADDSTEAVEATRYVESEQESGNVVLTIG